MSVNSRLKATKIIGKHSIRKRLFNGNFSGFPYMRIFENYPPFFFPGYCLTPSQKDV